MTSINASPFVPRGKRIRFNDPVRIEVGPENNRETFTIDAEVLTTRSLFFRKALSGSFKEAEERVVKLPEDNPETFGIYLHYVQTNELSVLPDHHTVDYNGNEEKHHLARLYVLAEKLQDVKAKNAIMKGSIASCYEERPGNHRLHRLVFFNRSAIKTIYRGTMKGSMMRRFLVDITAWDGNDEYVLSSANWPWEFLQEVVIKLMHHRNAAGNSKRFWPKDHPEDYMEAEIEE